MLRQQSARAAAFSHDLPVKVDELPVFLTGCGAGLIHDTGSKLGILICSPPFNADWCATIPGAV